MELPDGFREKMLQLLGEEFEALDKDQLMTITEQIGKRISG